MSISDQELIRLFAQVKNIAIVGAVDKPNRPVDSVGRYLIKAGFTVLPVHPKRQNVWGLTTYPSLADIPVPIDIVNLFRRSELCAQHAIETLALNPLPQCFWMQSNISSKQAVQILQGHPILVIQNHCLMLEHSRFAENLS